MNQNFKVVLLRDIEDNRLYDIHPFLEDAQLDNDIARSIQMIGLLTPPVIIEKTGGKYETICGRQRILHLRSLNRTCCYCQLLPDQCSAENILTIILEDQFATGPLTIVEQACFIKICKQMLSDRKRRNSFLQSLLPGRITKGNQYLTPLAELEKSIQSAIHHGRISEKIVSGILHFNSIDQSILLSLIESLKIGGNNQKKLIVQLRDILRRNETSLATFIEDEKLQKILSNIELDRSEKASRFLEHIQRLHQPLLTSSQDSFDLQIKELKLPDSITITPTSSFEKDDVTLNVRFRSLEAFKKRWDILWPYLRD